MFLFIILFLSSSTGVISKNPTGLYYALPTSTQIIQRKARHIKVERTLRYDHVSDDMARDHFRKIGIKSVNTQINFKSNNDQNLNRGYI